MINTCIKRGLVFNYYVAYPKHVFPGLLEYIVASVNVEHDRVSGERCQMQHPLECHDSGRAVPVLFLRRVQQLAVIDTSRHVQYR